MTRLACFYNDLDPRAEAALVRYAPAVGLEVEWVDTSGSQHAYADELEKRWAGDEDLIIVEQDKEIFPGTLPELMGCIGQWCTCPCWLYPEPHTVLGIGAFGAVKFSSAVQRMVRVSDFAGDRQQGIDRRFGDLLRMRFGCGACLHSMVLHHHVYEPRPKAVREHVASLRAQGLLPPAMAPAVSDPGLLPGSYRLPGR